MSFVLASIKCLQFGPLSGLYRMSLVLGSTKCLQFWPFPSVYSFLILQVYIECFQFRPLQNVFSLGCFQVYIEYFQFRPLRNFFGLFQVSLQFWPLPRRLQDVRYFFVGLPRCRRVIVEYSLFTGANTCSEQRHCNLRENIRLVCLLDFNS